MEMDSRTHLGIHRSPAGVSDWAACTTSPKGWLTYFVRFTGLGYGDKVADFIWPPTHRAPPDPETRWSNKLFNQQYRWFQTHFVHRNLVIHYATVSERTVPSLVARLQVYRPKGVAGYHSSLSLLANYMKRKGLTLNVKAVISIAERMVNRKLLEEAFRCPVFDSFASREVGFLAHECQAHQGLHLNHLTHHFEFLKQNEQVEPGEMGEIIVTDFNNYAMPFIRYRLGDFGRYSTEKCSCGRNLPMLQQVDGRSVEFMKTPSG
ncbi:MAG TPA: hypothetical protein VMV49_12560, partial [Candidatus Deferrimicrobium sp.]|nr:hypothetical protein [Candidatus Deferrimicrobium sp.]